MEIVKTTVPREWIIWSIEHSGWWRPNRKGYTPLKECAGKYTFEEACEIVASANKYTEDTPLEAMIKWNK